MSKRIFASAVTALLTWNGVPEPTAADSPPLYTAVYEVTRSGVRGKTTDRVAESDAPGVYVLQSSQQVTGAASLLISRKPSQESVFQLTENGIRVTRFDFDDGTGKGKDDVSVRFDWDSQQAAYSAVGTTVEIPLEPGTLDPIAVRTAVMLEAADGAETLHYPVLEKGSIRQYRFHLIGNEEVSTPGGEFRAVKYRLDSGRSYDTYYWLAPELSYLPVHIEQQRDKKSAVITLKSVEGL